MHDDDHDLGLRHDLQVISRQLAERRRLLRYMAAGGALAVLHGCGGDEADATVVDSGSTDSGTGSSSSSGSGTTTTSGCVAHPEETNGPYPSDGTNYANGSISNVLLQSGVVRSDIRSSFGTSANVASGVPLQLDITIANSNAACAPLAGWALYVWHCTSTGLYSLYSSGVQGENYLRGVQVSDADGKLGFTTIFPGCYAGRYPHIHFELFQSLEVATGYVNRVLTSQIALPREACTAVYSGSGYGSSLSNLSRVTIASDNVFGDNTSAQIAAQTAVLTGDATQGYVASVVIGVPW